MASAKLGDVPPSYKIDLSLPPAQRYVQVAQLYREQLLSLTGIFDKLVGSIVPNLSIQWIQRLARLFLRRVYSSEETEEIRGISRATGIEMYLIVCLNVLLDVLMGCTSGAARSTDPNGDPRMLHFRTLDWGMDALRRVLVRFDFVRGPDYDTVLATSISYVGFVGVLTGVRRGLSVSLNFRPNHEGGWLGDLRFYGSQMLVLLGLRRSISSMLRGYIVPSDPPRQSWVGRMVGWSAMGNWLPEVPTLQSIRQEILRTPSTAAYLVLCDGVEATVIEKDHRTAFLHSSSAFIVATNNDHVTPQLRSSAEDTEILLGAALGTGELMTVGDFMRDSKERRECMQAHWDKKVAEAETAARLKRTGRDTGHDLRRTRSSRQAATSVVGSSATLSEDVTGSNEEEVTASAEEIIAWTAKYPTTNEMTHFAAVLDPTEGSVVWIRRFPDPLTFNKG